MKIKPIYLLGAIILFFGLLIINLGHAAHLETVGEETENEVFHQLEHILEGLVLVPIGIGLMLYSNKREKKLITKK